MAIVGATALVLHASRTNRVLVSDAQAALRRPLTWIVGVPALAVTFLVGGPYPYLQSIGGPSAEPLTFADLAMAPVAGSTTTAAGPPAGPSEVEGAWAVGKGSQARYKVDDTVMGQTEEVLGTTPDVTGSMTIVDKTVTAVKIVVNMQTVACKCQHDDKYHDMLDTDVYPTSTFELTKPIGLASIPAEGRSSTCR